MSADDLTALIPNLPNARLTPQDPPSGLDLTIEWNIPFGTISMESVNWGELDILSSRIDAGLFVSGDEIRRQTTATAVSCPACGATEDLAFRGLWGSPADLICPCGHRWTPWSDSPAYGVSAMQYAIVRAIREQGLPT